MRTISVTQAGIIAALIVAGNWLAQTRIGAPQLPQAIPSVVYPAEGPYTITPVASGTNLQTAITGAGCGTILDLATNGTWSTTMAYTLPNSSCACHTDSTKWTIIRSHAFAGGSVRGARLDPSLEYNNLAHISSSDVNYGFAVLGAGSTASCYWFLGLDVTETAANSNSAISWGDGFFAPASFPHDFVFDHGYCHGQPTLRMTRCITLNGNWEAVVDSYISDAHGVGGGDTQAIAGWDGFGPILIQNNTLEGASENFLMGGNIPHVAGISIADVTFTKNYAFKPLSWFINSPTYQGQHWSIKNLFENKNVQRELVTANVFQNNWADAQNGKDILFDVENVSSGNNNPNPQAMIADINFNLNEVIGGAGIGNIATSNSNMSPINIADHRMSFHDDLYIGIDECLWGSSTSSCGSSNGWLIDSIPHTATYAPFDITMNHETESSASMSSGMFFNNTPLVDLHYGITITNSIIDGGGNGAFFGNTSGAGNGIIANYAPGANFKNTCAYGGNQNLGNLSNFANSQTPANQAAIFVSPGTDWHVAATSVCFHAASDGLSMGANIDALNAAISGVVQTLGCPVTLTNVSPSTFTHTGGTGLTLTGTCFLNESGLGVIIGGAGPAVATTSDTGTGCGFPGRFTVNGTTDTTHFTYAGGLGTCTVVAAAPITLATNDSLNVYYTGSFGTYTENVNRYTPGNACTSVMVTSSTTITCNAPAASGTVTTGPVSVFVSQWGIPVQSTVFGNYN